MRRLVGSDTSELKEFPLSTDGKKLRNPPATDTGMDSTMDSRSRKVTDSPKNPSRFPKWVPVMLGVLLLCALGIGAWAARTFLLPEIQSARTLRVGDELSDDRVILKLDKVGWNENYDRVGGRRAPVSFYFSFTNNSGETIIAQFDKTDFVVEDNTGRRAECWFFHISGAVDNWNQPLNDRETLQIIARCGDENVPPDVDVYTLTIYPFTSLPESRWIVEVER